MKTSLLFAGMLIGLVAVTNGCAAEATSAEDESGADLLQSEDDLIATPGQNEVASLIKDLTAGGFSGATVNTFVDAKVGVYSVFRPRGILGEPRTFRRGGAPCLRYAPSRPQRAAELAAHIRSGALSDLYEQIAWRTKLLPWSSVMDRIRPNSSPVHARPER